MRLNSVERILKQLVPKRYYSKYVANKLMRFYDSVLEGPFKGMKYISSSIGSKLYPKILGIYEKELHELVNRIIDMSYKQVINVGAAEGYFSVGFALKCNEINVLAYEMEEQGRNKIKELAEMNGVSDMITVKGECTIEELKQNVVPSCLIVMDVEGFEDVLLDPINCKQLLETDILVEMHESRVSGVEERVKSRFERTHDLEEILAVKRDENDLNIPIELKIDQRIINIISFGNFRRQVVKRLVDEYRPSSIKWFWIKRKLN